MNIPLGTAWGLAAMLLLTATASGRAQAPQAFLTVDQLVRLWQEREARVQTLRVEFKQVHLDPRRGNPVELTGLLWIEEDRWRAQTSGPLWHDPSKRFIDTNYVQLFDGRQFLKHFDRNERENDVFPWATYRSPDAPEMKLEATEPTPLPWLLNYRNSHPVFSIISPEEWQSDPRTVVIDGLRCFAVVHKQSQFSGWVFWVAPELDYRVLRREADLHDTLARDEIRYERDPEFGWVPSRWSETVHIKKADGTLILDWDDQYTVEKLQINQPFPEDPFDYRLAEGTWVKGGAVPTGRGI